MPTRTTRRRTIRTGLLIVGILGVAVLAIFNKPAILSAVRPGENLDLAFDRNYKIEPYSTVVKIGGSKVGEVSAVEPSDDGGTTVSLKLDNGTRALLGTDPSAEVRPNTVLGGKYYVDLRPGGSRGTFEGDSIPRQRTRVPVELDTVLAAIPPEAQRGLQATTERLDASFQAGVGKSLDRLLETAPNVLPATGVTIDAFRGVRQDTDLTTTVVNLNKTAEVLNRTPGQLGEVVDALESTSQALADNADPVTRTVATLPDVLRTTRSGAVKLAGTLHKVADVADDARPAVQQLDPLLKELDPALAELRPVLSDLRPVLADARPMAEQLNPTVEQGTAILGDLDGPVLDRVNGPMSDQLLGEWKGYAPKYKDGGRSGVKYYEEIGHLLANINNAIQYYNATSHIFAFQAGPGTTSVEGTGDALRELQRQLSQGFGPPHQDPPLQLPPANGVRLPENARNGVGG